MSLKYLENFPSYYWKTYRGLRDNFYEGNPLYDIGEEAFQSKVVNALPEQETLKILGIGSGQGELDCLNMRRTLTRFPRIDNTVVEPSVEAIEVYKSLVSGDLSDRVSTTWYPETFQQYQQRRKSNNATNKFHFISAVHSLYYADKDGSSIGYLIDLLEKDGVLFIAIENDDSGFTHFFERVAESYGPRHNNETQDYVTSKITKLIDEDGRAAYEVVKKQYKIDITSCFEAESSDGPLLLDFMTHVVDFVSSVSKDVLQMLLDYLKTAACSEILSDDKVIFRQDWDAIIIKRN